MPCRRRCPRGALPSRRLISGSSSWAAPRKRRFGPTNMLSTRERSRRQTAGPSGHTAPPCPARRSKSSTTRLWSRRRPGLVGVFILGASASRPATTAMPRRQPSTSSRESATARASCARATSGGRVPAAGRPATPPSRFWAAATPASRSAGSESSSAKSSTPSSTPRVLPRRARLSPTRRAPPPATREAATSLSTLRCSAQRPPTPAGECSRPSCWWRWRSASRRTWSRGAYCPSTLCRCRATERSTETRSRASAPPFWTAPRRKEARRGRQPTISRPRSAARWLNCWASTRPRSAATRPTFSGLAARPSWRCASYCG
mmetsp:Transcript_20324/g.68899  ORF Transcript_20324/g.68899 Transcript_20324/m.68899 type:complete len:318 (-) Transcript_20324:530-1483(-)